MALWLAPGMQPCAGHTGQLASSNCLRSVPISRPRRSIPVAASWQECGSCTGFAGQQLRLRMAPADRHRRGHRLVTRMASKVTGTIKLALNAGKANPSPPVGPALGAKGVNIMAFCKDYNAATQSQIGTIIPVEITVFEDRSFTFILKTPPASILLKKAAGIPKGSATPQGPAVGSVTEAQIREIAETKLPDLNCQSIEPALNIIRGTAKGMGIKVKP